MDKELKPCSECDGSGVVVGFAIEPSCCQGSDWECGGRGCTGPHPEQVETQEACNHCMATGYVFPASAVATLQARVRELEAENLRLKGILLDAEEAIDSLDDAALGVFMLDGCGHFERGRLLAAIRATVDIPRSMTQAELSAMDQAPAALHPKEGDGQ